MRQVLGSDLWNIIMLFSKDFIIFTSISFLLAVPVSYYWITGWLNSFEVKVAITVWNFVLPYIAALLMTVITIIIIVKRTASMNPSDNLRTE
jgi:ABC-type antimicrobial peptide transport system permease subunit